MEKSVASGIYPTLALAIGNISALSLKPLAHFGGDCCAGLVESLIVIQVEYFQCTQTIISVPFVCLHVYWKWSQLKCP